MLRFRRWIRGLRSGPMLRSVRGSAAIAVAVALAVGVASGWWLGDREQSDVTAVQESWLFSHTADSGEIRERSDGSLELVLRSFDEQLTAFTDRPFRDAKIEPVEWLVSQWDALFADSPPNAVLVEHDPDGATRSVVVELSTPQMSGGELTYGITVLDLLPEGPLARVAGLSHENPVRSFEAVSLFIDDVSLSCAQGGGCEVGDTGPGGGKVFSVGDSGSYLEAAPADLPGKFTWTDAVPQASTYRGGGMSDWYLPSKDELNQLYAKRAQIGGFRTSIIGEGDFYWSSSGFPDGIEAYGQWFDYGGQIALSKLTTGFVRPIRAG